MLEVTVVNRSWPWCAPRCRTWIARRVSCC